MERGCCSAFLACHLNNLSNDFFHRVVLDTPPNDQLFPIVLLLKKMQIFCLRSRDFIRNFSN